MKFACHMAKALSRVAITILVGMVELGIYITMRKFREPRLPFILARPTEEGLYPKGLLAKPPHRQGRVK
jgi:hypothetical protein